MPSIIYSEEELEDVMTSTNNKNNKNEDGMNKSKQKLDNEDMIGALKEMENKINAEKNNMIEEENENMEITNYNNIVDQKDEEGNLVERKNTEGRKETLITLTGKAVESNHNVFTQSGENNMMESQGDKTNYQNDAKILKEALTSPETDEDKIIALTVRKNNKQRQEIRRAYKSFYGKDLIEELNEELDGNFKKVVHAMYLSPTEYDVTELRKAMEGLGTNEDTLSEIIGSRKNEKLEEIKDLYKLKYNEEIESRIKSETSGDYRHLLCSLLQCVRDENNEIDENLVSADVDSLYKAGEGKWGTDEEIFAKIFALRNSCHLKEMDSLYEKQKGKNLIQVVESEFSGDIKILLKTILHYHINPVDYYANRIHDACKGFGTNDTNLIRSLVVIDENYLGEVKNIYQSKFGISLREQIIEECKGDYKNMLLALVDSP